MEISMAKRPLWYLMLGTLVMGLAASPAFAQGNGNNGGGNNGGGSNGGGNNGGTNGNNGGANNGNSAGAAKGSTNGNANGVANGNANPNANANGKLVGSQSAVDEALEAVETGNAMPLRDIQAMLETQYPGVLIEAQLQRRGAAFFYDLTVLSPQGRVYVVTVEAATGLVLGR
jgi:uncharacterized membrane protein YkoI